MKKTLLSITVVVLLFAGCNDKDDTTPKAEKWYISKSIEKRGSGNADDTTVVTYNADNTVKEFSSGSGIDYQASGPVYEGGKIIRIQEKRSEQGTPGTRASFVYTGDQLTRINNFGFDGDRNEWYDQSYDSLVYKNGKLSEFYELEKTGYALFFRLTWEGSNVKTVERYSKAPEDADYTLHNIATNTYDNKPALHLLLNNNYIWLVNVMNFENLSANNLVKQEVHYQPSGVLNDRTTITLTYNDAGLPEGIDTKWEYLQTEPSHVENSQTLFIYTKR